MFRNLIFDWSGTLCDDLALTLEATNNVLSRYGRPALTRGQFRAEFQLPYPEYYAHKIPEAKLEDLENYYRRAFDASVLSVSIIPHAREFMEFCAARGIRCFALTSMDPKAFEEQSRELGIQPYFEHIHSGIHNKETHILQLMKMHRLQSRETAFIGDMQHDINAAHCAGVTGIAVLTGYNNAEQLALSCPDLCVPHLGALQALMERCPQHRHDSIRLNGLEFSCRIGVPDEERALPQRLKADVEIFPRRRFAAMGEDLAQSIDYDALARRLATVAQEEPTVLLETLADKLARCCVQEFGARAATVELHKFILPQVTSCSVRCSYSG